jgi:hypothetical protein
MNLLPFLANLAWVASSWPGGRQFRRALHCPEQTQDEWLSRHLARHGNAAYGRAHGVDGIRSYAEFARRVPLVDYEDLEAWIRRIQRGEAAVLSTDPVQHLIPTSGSLGAQKLIPFTAGLERDFNAALGPWIMDLHRAKPRLACGPAYWSITPAAQTEAKEPSAIPIGFEDDGQYLGGVRRRFVDAVMAVPPVLRQVTDQEAFRYLTLLCLLRHRDLRLMSVWHPTFLMLLLDRLPGIWGELLHDLRAGECSRAIPLPAAVRSRLGLVSNPRRVRELKRADPTRPESLWPDLQMISCWGDAHAELAVQELKQRFPNTEIQVKGLLATEAFVTIPFAGRHPLAIRSHFFEFIDDEGAILRSHELREGERYDVVVTTSGGLWRYRLRDRVEVRGFFGQTPSLRFLGKSNAVSDLCGEKLAEPVVAEAVREVSATLGLTPRFAMVAAEEGPGGPGYVLYWEGSVAPGLAGCFETILRRNPHYAWCRDLGQLPELRLFQIEEGGYENFVAREMEHGRRLGEIKPIALSCRTGWRFSRRLEPAVLTRRDPESSVSFQ